MTKRSFGPGSPLAASVLLVVAALTCWSGPSRSAQAQVDPAQPSLSLLGDPLALQLKEGEEEIPARVVVRNGSGRPLGLEFSAVLRDSTGELLEEEISVEPEKPTTVESYSVTPVDLEMDAAQLEGLSLPLKGFLVVSGTKSDGTGTAAMEIAPGTLPITVSRADPRPDILSKVPNLPVIGPMDSRNLVLLAPFLVSLVVVGIACVWFYATKSDDEKPADRWKYAPLVGKRSGLGTGLAFNPGTSWGRCGGYANQHICGSTSIPDSTGNVYPQGGTCVEFFFRRTTLGCPGDLQRSTFAQT